MCRWVRESVAVNFTQQLGGSVMQNVKPSTEGNRHIQQDGEVSYLATLITWRTSGQSRLLQPETNGPFVRIHRLFGVKREPQIWVACCIGDFRDATGYAETDLGLSNPRELLCYDKTWVLKTGLKSCGDMLFGTIK